MLALCAGVPSASAQRGPDPIRIRVTPEVPGPNASVTIELQDSTTTLGDAVITWSKDGKVALSGVARRTFTFETRGVGETTQVHVLVEKGSAIVEREFTFRPSVVTLVWEADTYVPPFYKGKALASPGAQVRVFAFADVRDPRGNRIAESDLFYEWEKDGVKFADRSGIGVASFSFEASQLAPGERVSLTVRTRDGEIAGRSSLLLTYYDPLLLLYERHPLRGIRYERALSPEASFASQELTLVAEPYFFSVGERDGADLSHEWTVDGNPIEGGRGLVTLRNESEEGEAFVTISVQNTKRNRLLQTADATLRLFFGEGRSLFSF